MSLSQRETAEYQRAVDQMVRREVHACLSGVVHTLANAYGFGSGVAGNGSPQAMALGDLAEQAFELSSPVLDYESAAAEAGWSLKDGFVTRLADAVEPIAPLCDSWEEACLHDDIEPHENEVYEHWAISDWLADRLDARGEKVDRNFAGLTVWARTCTGQSIGLDSVICDIYDAIQRDIASDKHNIKAVEHVVSTPVRREGK